MSKATILLVEDDKVQARVTKDSLESFGHDVILATDGKSAIKSAKTQKVDIIILDLVLPDINGNEVSRWLKLNPDTKGIPIIMLTVRSSMTEKVAGLEAGADDYLPKPYDEIELNARIYACLRTKALQDELREKNRQLEDAFRKLEVQAITDPLTELFNRRYFLGAIEKEFKRTVRHKSQTSCLMIDIDHFKKVNDAYGHRAGDISLKEAATIIKNCARDIDTTARWGGEEFIVLLPETRGEDALLVAARILGAVSHHTFTAFPERITVSIGLATAPDPHIDTAEKLIHESDLALYAAKTKGRNQISVSD